MGDRETKLRKGIQRGRQHLQQARCGPCWCVGERDWMRGESGAAEMRRWEGGLWFGAAGWETRGTTAHVVINTCIGQEKKLLLRLLVVLCGQTQTQTQKKVRYVQYRIDKFRVRLSSTVCINRVSCCSVPAEQQRAECGVRFCEAEQGGQAGRLCSRTGWRGVAQQQKGARRLAGWRYSGR